MKVITEINGNIQRKPNQPCNYLNSGHKSKVNILGQYKEASKESRNPFISVGTFNQEPRYSQISLNIIIPETKHRKSNFILILCSVYAIMLLSKICEYLGSGLKVITEINGFLLSIDASLYQKRKIENLILC